MSDVARGFTLVQILIVVLIVCILAMIVVPQITDASDEARESAMRTDLRAIRAQIELYRTEHRTAYPSMELFVKQMTSKTHLDGTFGGVLGPYLPEIPPNPYNNDSTVKCGLEDDAGEFGDGASGWHYNPATGYFRANDSPEHAGW